MTHFDIILSVLGAFLIWYATIALIIQPLRDRYEAYKINKMVQEFLDDEKKE